MPKLNPKRHTKQELKRAARFRQKLTEEGLQYQDITNETGITRMAVCAYAFGRTRTKSKVAEWTIKKFGECFAQELEMILEAV